MLPLDVSSLVDDFDLTSALGPLKVERRVAPTLNAQGEFETAAPTYLRLSPWTAHTASGRNLQQVPEADRSTEVTEFYVQNTRLYVADGNRPPDILHYQDRRWRVVTVNRFGAQGRVWFVLAVLVDENEGA
jgi:PAS domain-containing protein